MGTKPSNNFQSDRPESGGADRHSERENSGLLDRNKEKYASDKAAEQHGESPSKHAGQTPSTQDRGGSRDGESAE